MIVDTLYLFLFVMYLSILVNVGPDVPGRTEVVLLLGADSILNLIVESELMVTVKEGLKSFQNKTQQNLFTNRIVLGYH